MAPVRYLVYTVRMTLITLVILSLVYLFSHFRLSSYFPIQSVRVYGTGHIDKSEVREALTPMVTHGFFGINVEAIRDRMLQMPWVDDILVRREWPDKISVTVIEKIAVARWNDEMLLSNNGTIFQPEPSSYPSDIPLFYGMPGKQAMILQVYTDINRILLPLHAKISWMELSPYLIWKLTLDNGIRLQIGQKDMLKRLSHFVRVYPKIVGEHAGDVEYIDLRYPNGIAVRWKEAVKT